MSTSQPNQEVYGVQELALFPSYTRESYRAKFGGQAPSWDPARVRKAWLDPKAAASDPASLVSYKIVAMDASGQWTLQPLAMTAREAATVNLPGTVTYPAYAVAPTTASRQESGINPIYLSLEADARELMATLGGDGLQDEGVDAVFPVQYPADEPRRLWNILFKGKPASAGALLLSRNAKGVGAPGQWDVTGSEPVWIPAPAAPTGLDDQRPPRPVPVRDLLPNEKLQTGLMGVSVIRTDLEQQSNELRGEFTPDDRATLQKIYQLVANRLS